MKSVNYTATLELLSPLHIGTGTWLLEGVDWVREGEWVYFADQDRLLEAAMDRAAVPGRDEAAAAAAITGLTLGQLRDKGWLERSDFSEASPLFRYRLRGQPAMNQIAEAIKDVYGRPYIPGSSLKGALRTVLAVGGATIVKPDLRRAGRNRYWAAQPIEREIFGADPNHDLLRALQVGDSLPVTPTQLELARVNVFPTARQTAFGRSEGLDLDLEALKRGTMLEATLKIDGTLFGDESGFGRTVEDELRFGKRRNWLLRLPQWANRVAGSRVAGELDYLEDRAGSEDVANFYRGLGNLLQSMEGKDEFLVQVGWGTGWHTKTFGELLQADSDSFEHLVQDYRLSPQDHRRMAGQRFPKSRKFVRRGERAAQPLGWIKVTLEKR